MNRDIRIILAFLLSLFLLLMLFVGTARGDVIGGQGLKKEVALLAREYDIPLDIALRLVYSESAWNPRAVEHDAYGGRSLGLMQLSEKLLPWFAIMFNRGKKIDPWSSRENIRIGLHYLAWLRVRHYSWASTLWAYNAGPGRCKQGRATWRTLNYIQYIIGEPPMRQTR